MHLIKISQSSERRLVAVINKVIIAWLFGDRGRNFRDLDVFQVQEAELHLHVEKSVHVGASELTGHLLPQQCIQPIYPHAVLKIVQNT